MNTNVKRKILKLEMLNILRSKRLILLLIVLPLIIYPLLMFGFMNTNEDTVAVPNEVTIGFSREPSEGLKKAIEDTESKYKINIDAKVTSYLEALKEGAINAYFHISNKEDGLTYTIYTDTNIEKNIEVVDQLELAINSYNNSIISEKLVPKGNELELAMYNFIEVETQPTTLIEIIKSTIKEPIAVSLPYILILNMMIVGLCVAVMSRLKNDNIGEAEILISSGVTKAEFINNKYMVVLLTTIVNGLISALSIGISGMIIYLINKPHIQELLIKLKINIRLIHVIIVAIYILVAMITIAMTITTICVYISSISKKYSKLINIVVLLAAIWILWKQIYFFVYIVTMSRDFEMFINDFVILSSIEICSYGFIITYIVIKLFDRDKAIFGIDKYSSPIKCWRNKERNRLPSPSEALLVYSMTNCAINIVCNVPGIIMSVQVIYGIFIVIAIIYFKLDIKNTLSFRVPKCRYIVGAILIYISAYIIRVMINDKIPEILLITTMPQVLVVDMNTGETSMWLIILITAISPAIFEELLFRGIVFSGLSNTNRGEIRKKSVIFAILVSSILFAVVHGELRGMPGIAISAIVYSYIVYKTGSIYLPMLLHLYNNASNALINRYPDSAFATARFEFYRNVIIGQREVAILIVVVCIILAVILFRKTKKERQKDNPEVSMMDVV